MKKNNLMSGALILSIGGILAKLFSAVYRIALTRIVGGVGIGIYQLIFPLYSLCVVLTTAGLPMAISKVVAKHSGGGKIIVKKCLKVICLISFLLTLLLIAFSGVLADLQGKREIAICYIILAPTLIIIGASSVLRGYFQGKQNFTPSAISNILEQFVKMVVGLLLCVVLLNVNLIAGIIGLMMGIFASEVVSFLVLVLFYKKFNEKTTLNIDLSFKMLFKDIFPITLTNVILPISVFIDSILVVNLLSINFTKEMSIYLYGLESGAVATIVNLPTIFSFAIASVILPDLSGESNIINKNRSLSLAVKIVLIICVPCVICFTLIPNQLLSILYGGTLNDFSINGTMVAARLLSISGLGLVFLALNQIYSSALQAADERMVTVRNMTIAVVVKFVLELVFMPSANLSIYVLAIANTLCYLIVMVLNLLDINLKYHLKINYNFSAKLLLCNLFMLLSLLAALNVVSSAYGNILAVLLAGVVYVLSLFFTNIFSRQDKAMLKYKV